MRSRCVPDSGLSREPDRETLEGLFTLIDFLLGEEVRMGAVNINDVRQNKCDKIIQLLRALHEWERHRAILQPIGTSTPQDGPSQTLRDKSADE